MAVQQGYGKVAGANSLVFAYDTTDTRNSFKGRPTVNQFLHHGVSGRGSAADNFVNFPVQGTTGFKRLGYGQTFGGYTIKPEDVVYYYDKVDLVSCHYHGNVASVPVGAYVVFSFDFYLSPTITVENGSLANIENYGNSALSGGITGVNSSTEKGVWHRRVQVFGPKGGTVAGSQAMFLYPGGCSARLSSTPGFILYKNPQVEFVNFTTESPFVQGTRSSTESLLDLTGNCSIDLTNAVFNSDGSFTFDGTNTAVPITGLTVKAQENKSYEAVIKLPTGYAQTGNIIGGRGNSTNVFLVDSERKLRGGEDDQFVIGSTQMQTGIWYHVAYTFEFDGATTSIQKLYINGVLDNQTTQTNYIDVYVESTQYLGYDWRFAYYFNGDIAACKVYSKTLTATEVESNFKNYRKRFEGLDYYTDDITDGGGWIRWWWYTGVGWPGHETEALGHSFGTFDSSSHYGFQRLPEGLNKDSVELLAKDGDGNIYKWDFADTSGTAQHVWDSFTQGTQGVWANDGAFMPTVIAGGFHGGVQDTWQYRVSEGVASFLLDDDSCDCISTLNAGHAMCGGSGWSQTYAQPDGAYLRYGVDTLNDGGCLGPIPTRRLELFYRLK